MHHIRRRLGGYERWPYCEERIYAAHGAMDGPAWWSYLHHRE